MLKKLFKEKFTKFDKKHPYFITNKNKNQFRTITY